MSGLRRLSRNEHVATALDAHRFRAESGVNGKGGRTVNNAHGENSSVESMRIHRIFGCV
jgi:hypothetical protein